MSSFLLECALLAGDSGGNRHRYSFETTELVFQVGQQHFLSFASQFSLICTLGLHIMAFRGFTTSYRQRTRPIQISFFLLVILLSMELLEGALSTQRQVPKFFGAFVLPWVSMRC